MPSAAPWSKCIPTDFGMLTLLLENFRISIETITELTCHSATPSIPHFFQKGSSTMVMQMAATRPMKQAPRSSKTNDSPCSIIFNHDETFGLAFSSVLICELALTLHMVQEVRR